MKIASILAHGLLAIGIAAALGIAFAPQLVDLLGSGPSVKGPGYAAAVAIVLFAVVGLLLLLAVVASFLAWLAARRAGLNPGMRWLCWLPLPLALAATLWLWAKLTH